uniref:Uncharacterized protein n=1 Tax=Serinus canaria TaxID=9135 RepID=A0A8C9N0T5_SERCA
MADLGRQLHEYLAQSKAAGGAAGPSAVPAPPVAGDSQEEAGDGGGLRAWLGALNPFPPGSAPGATVWPWTGEEDPWLPGLSRWQRLAGSGLCVLLAPGAPGRSGRVPAGVPQTRTESLALSPADSQTGTPLLFASSASLHVFLASARGATAGLAARSGPGDSELRVLCAVSACRAAPAARYLPYRAASSTAMARHRSTSGWGAGRVPLIPAARDRVAAAAAAADRATGAQAAALWTCPVLRSR